MVWAQRYGKSIPYGDLASEPLSQELYNRVIAIADDEELAFDPDEESVRERFQEDLRLCLGEHDEPAEE